MLQLFQSKNISSFLSDVLQNPSQSPETLLLKFSETLWPLFCFNGDADVLLPSKEASCLCFIILLNSPFPYIYQAFNDIKNPERYDIGYPGGETTGAVQQRFMKFINKLFEEGRERVLLVTHGMLIRIFAEICLKKTIRLENGSVLRVAFDEKTKKFKSAKVLF